MLTAARLLACTEQQREPLVLEEVVVGREGSALLLLQEGTVGGQSVTAGALGRGTQVGQGTIL